MDGVRQEEARVRLSRVAAAASPRPPVLERSGTAETKRREREREVVGSRYLVGTAVGFGSKEMAMSIE